MRHATAHPAILSRILGLGILSTCLPCSASLVASESDNPTLSSESLASDYLQTYTRLHATWLGCIQAELKLDASRNFEHGEVRFDPWLGMDQESDYYPRCDSLIRKGELRDDEMVLLPEVNLGKFIPARFRLAELLGLGRVEYRMDTEFMDPILVAASAFHGGFRTMSRVHHHIYGEWIPKDAGDPPYPDCFRVLFNSRSRVETSIINPDHGEYLSHYQVANFSFKYAYRPDLPSASPWGKEGLHSQVMDQSSTLLPSANQTALARPSLFQFQTQLEIRLEEIKNALRNHFIGTQACAAWRENLEALGKMTETMDHAALEAGHDPIRCYSKPMNAVPTTLSIVEGIKTGNHSAVPLPAPETVRPKLERWQDHLIFHMNHGIR